LKILQTFELGVLIANKALKFLIPSLFLLLILATAAAAINYGELDPAFGADGIVTSDLGTLFDEYSDITIQPDHKIIAVGTAISDDSALAITVTRYSPDGSPDMGFGTNGTKKIMVGELGFEGDAVALQNDGKIVVAGSGAIDESRDIVVIRLETDGDLDPAFATNGIFTASLTPSDDFATDVAILYTGQIAVSAVGNTGSESRPFVVRLTANGTIDSSFGGDGIVEVPLADGSAGQLKGIGFQNDNRIVVAGEVRDGVQQDFLTARFHPNGDLDQTFGGTGVLSTAVGSGNDAGEALVIRQDGKIVVAGSATENQQFDFALVRYNTDGSLDTSFGEDGKVITPSGDGSSIAFDVKALPNGGIIAAGDLNLELFGSEIVLHQYLPDGGLDPTFGNGGIAFADVTSGFDIGTGVVRDQTTGRILVAGGSGAFGPSPDSVVVAFTGAPDEAQDQKIFLPVIFSD